MSAVIVVNENRVAVRIVTAGVSPVERASKDEERQQYANTATGPRTTDARESHPPAL
jgi:hypothetical protein